MFDDNRKYGSILKHVKAKLGIQPSKIDGQFKTILGGTTNECLCLTRNDELYLLELVDRAPVLSKIIGQC